MSNKKSSYYRFKLLILLILLVPVSGLNKLLAQAIAPTSAIYQQASEVSGLII